VKTTRAAFIGFGEAAKALISIAGDNAPEVISAFDIKTRDEATREAKLMDYIKYQVNGAFNPVQAASGAQVIFSLVTPDQAKLALEPLHNVLTEKQYVVDCNSCAPAIKKHNAQLVESQGAAYIDAAIMSPVKANSQQIPLYISGKKATQIAPQLHYLGFDVTVISEKAGDASQIKMLRSAMVKGLEALTTECILAAYRAGVAPYVIESLEKSYPQLNLSQLAIYHMERMLTHGKRRSEELKSVVDTLASLNINTSMSGGAIIWHQLMSDVNVTVDNQTLEQLSNQILNTMEYSASPIPSNDALTFNKV
jgi:3-hydroxyisobutyrate dehydrogenase-like beta-hydroxyacid dehydrogenase